MKKHTTILAIAVAIAIVGIIALIASSDNIKTDDNLIGETYRVNYNYVNVREDSNVNSGVITTLGYGTEVTLTGRICERGGDIQNSTASWVEIQLADGSVGWLVRAAIQWMP